VQICELLNKLAAEYTETAIHIVLDNARYQKCKVVQDLAAQLHITLVYIPSYSPNLNLIERLWKFVKGRLRTKYYDKFDEFSERIDTIISSTCGSDKQRIDSLIGEKIQLFDNLVAVTQNSFTTSNPRKQTVA
jgi:transposase